MGVYVTSKCPHCGGHLKYFEPKSSHGKFGTPIIRCRFCDGLIKTGKLLWRDLGFLSKAFFISSLFVGSLMISILPAIVSVLILGDDIEEKPNIPWIVGGISSAILFLYQLRSLRINIKRIEKDYDTGKYELVDY